MCKPTTSKPTNELETENGESRKERSHAVGITAGRGGRSKNGGERVSIVGIALMEGT